MSIFVDGVHKTYPNGTAVLHDIRFEAAEGEMVAFLGPSGSGKTTLLRIIAGLDDPTLGRVYVRGQRVDQVPIQKRHIGVVFQNYALFQHMTVFDNIAFGLRVQRMGKAETRERIAELLDLVKLTGLEHRYPAQLSGGQAQRVALARALAPRPSVLLLDEPFSAIDANVRKELRHSLRELHERIGITSVFVTHDQEEAFEVADSVLVLNHGRVEQFGRPREVFHHPVTRFVAKFVGDVTELPALQRNGMVIAGPLVIPTCTEDSAQVSGMEGVVAIRPVDVRLHPAEEGYHGLARVNRKTFRGDHDVLDLSFHADYSLRAHVPAGSHDDWAVGQTVSVEIAGYTWFTSDAPAPSLSDPVRP